MPPEKLDALDHIIQAELARRRLEDATTLTDASHMDTNEPNDAENDEDPNEEVVILRTTPNPLVEESIPPLSNPLAQGQPNFALRRSVRLAGRPRRRYHINHSRIRKLKF